MSSSYSGYPGGWSDWAWIDQWQQWERHREISPGEFQYEYSPPTATAPPTESTPRNREVDPPLSALQSPYSVDVITHSMGATSLNTDPQTQQSYQSKGKQVDTSNSMNTPGSSFGTGYNAQRVSSQPTRTIKTQDDNTTVDKDKRFKVHRSKEFQFGRVFKVLWSEPMGDGGGSTIITEQIAVKHGEYSKVRRFLIVDETKRGHSICIPISTYGGRGLLKSGAHPEDHAVIYSSKPYLQKGEQVGLKPVRVEIKDPLNKLDRLSRLNYAKPFTIEHNVKVFWIGRVARSDEQQVVTDYRLIHPPLADRPYVNQNNDFSGDMTQGAEGAEPEYTSTPGQESSQWVSRSTQHTGRQLPTTVAGTTYPALTPYQVQGQGSGGEYDTNYDPNYRCKFSHINP